MFTDSGFKAVRYTSVKDFMQLIYEKYRNTFRIDSIELRGRIVRVKQKPTDSLWYASFRLEDLEDSDSSVYCYISKEKVQAFVSLIEEGRTVEIWGRADFNFEKGNFCIEVTYIGDFAEKPELRIPERPQPKIDYRPLETPAFPRNEPLQFLPSVEPEPDHYSTTPFGALRRYIVLLIMIMFTLLIFLVLINVSA